MFLLFSMYFDSLNLKYLKLSKMDITHFTLLNIHIMYPI